MFFLDLQTLRAEDEGWLVLDVTAASDHWLLNRSKDLGLRLYLETEDGEDGRAAPFSAGSGQRAGLQPGLQLSPCGPAGQVAYPASRFSPGGGAFRLLSATRGLGRSLLHPRQWAQGAGRRPQVACVTTRAAWREQRVQERLEGAEPRGSSGHSALGKPA